MILDIDQQLVCIKQEIVNITKDLYFIEFCQFNLNEEVKEIFTLFDELRYSGVYLIEIKNNSEFSAFNDWIEFFLPIWLGENEIYKRKFTPNLKKKRIKAHNNLGEWIPLYIGKSKNIRDRISGHIFSELDKTTFALKLLSRKNLYNNIFRLSTIRVQVKNYDIIMPIIESELRNKINPIIGRQ